LTSVTALFAGADRVDRVGLRAGLGLTLVSSLVRPLYPLLFKILVDAAVSRESRPAVVAAVAIALGP
jgi:hypothetical protein